MSETDTDDPITDQDLRRDWIEVLAVVWRAADWNTIASRSHPATDVFQHRLRTASTRPSVQEAIRKLCHGLSLQAPEMPTGALDELIANERDAMRLIRTEDVWLTLKAKETVQAYYDADGEPADASGDPDIKTTNLSDFIDIQEDSA